jgi:hypothetical protein
MLKSAAASVTSQQLDCYMSRLCIVLWHTRSVSVDQALKSVKGVLNKLTPEKFDRLLGQLVAAVTSVDVLNGLIKLVFDNAVRDGDLVI